ncbi:MAG: hypothetical protein U0136_10155 [Bdellovibrionota bacterium]
MSVGTLAGCAHDGPTLNTGLSLIGLQSREINDPALQLASGEAQKLHAQIPQGVTSDIHKAADLQRAGSQSSASAAQNKNFRILPLSELDLYGVQNASHQGEINAFEITKDGSRAFTGGSDGSVVSSTIIKPDSENKQATKGARHGILEVKTLLTGKKPVSALALSPDERYLAVAKFSAVFVFDLQEQKILYRMSRVSGSFPSLAWDPRGELLLFGRTSGEVFAWHVFAGRAAGRDNLESIEQYGDAGGSPIVRILFHPSGRAFVAVERNGGLTLWRLLRTEEELGLRDRYAEDDQGNTGKEKSPLGSVTGLVEDAWLDPRAEQIYVSSIDGNINQFRLRGLVRGPEIEVGADSVTNIEGIDVKNTAGAITPFLVTSGRGQKLKFYCRPKTFNDDSSEPETRRVPVITSKTANSPADNDPQIIDGRIVVPEEALPKPPEPKKNKAETEGFFVAESEPLKEPVSFMRSGSSSAVLWAAQKKGNLLVFDARPLLSSLAPNCPAK